jgi:uncharacterized protein
MMEFKCEKCGLCCKKVNCMYLTEENLCSIYEKRPLVCNVDKGYEAFFSKVMSKEEFNKLNRKICITLQEEK